MKTNNKRLEDLEGKSPKKAYFVAMEQLDQKAENGERLFKFSYGLPEETGLFTEDQLKARLSGIEHDLLIVKYAEEWKERN